MPERTTPNGSPKLRFRTSTHAQYMRKVRRARWELKTIEARRQKAMREAPEKLLWLAQKEVEAATILSIHCMCGGE